MAIKKEDVKHIAMLARLKFKDEEIKYFAGQLSCIIEYIDQLKEVKTSGVEPMSHVLSVQNVFRRDLVKPSLDKEAALKNAPAKEEGLFKVPRIIEEL